MLTKVSMRFVSIFSILLCCSFLCLACSKQGGDRRIHSYDNSNPPRTAIKYEPCKDWVSVKPKNLMRLEEYSIAKNSSFSVYYLPGGAGTVIDNKQRWQKQFVDNSEKEILLEEQFNLGSLPITKFYIKGDYLEAENPFMTDTKRVTRKDWSLFAIIVETAEGKWFFKALGPSAEISKEQGNLHDFALSIRAGN